jgi:TPR repeat protein
MGGAGRRADLRCGGAWARQAVAEGGPWVLMVKEARDLYLDGDLEGALSRFALAAEEGYAIAQANAAYMLERGKGYK